MGLVRYKKYLRKRVKRIFSRGISANFFKELKSYTEHDNINHVSIQTTCDTLNEIENCLENNERGAYLRFGDGDVYLLNNKKDAYQKPNDFLAREMLEAFQINQKNVFKSLAIHSDKFGFDKGMFPGNHKNTDLLAIKLLEATFLYFIGQKIYSPIALHFIASQEPIRANMFLKLLKSKTKLFVGNKELSETTVQMLFGDALHIKTPFENAYNEIDRIYYESKIEIEKFSDFAVVVIAMGCSGRPLMKRLLLNKSNIFLFDFGSLIDGVDGVNNRTWLKVANINYEILTKDLYSEKKG